MKITGQVEIVNFMPIFLLSLCSFGQYEMKSSEATPFPGSILMPFKSLEPPQYPLHAS